MISLLVAILTTVTLTSPFGEASATAERNGAYIEVTVAVEVDTFPAPNFVVVHVLRADGQDTFSLGPRGDGVYETSFFVNPSNRAISFEAAWADGNLALSQTTSLAALGVDPSLLVETFETRSLGSSGNARWGWLALASGALALMAMVWWLLWPKPVREVELARLDDGTANVYDESGDGAELLL